MLFKSQKHQSKKYIGVLLDLLFVEAAVTTLFYHSYNKSGQPSFLWMLAVSVVGSIRATSSLFLTLIVSMGYGTVRADLKGNERLVYSMTIAHLALSLGNIFATISSSDRSLIYVAFFALPLTALNISYFVWSWSELKKTKRELEMKKQMAKLKMYDSLTRAMDILMLIAGFLLFMSLLSLTNLATTSSPKAWMAANWQHFWFFGDGWSMLLVLGGTCIVAYLWRPRLHNRTFGMEQVLGEEEDGECADVKFVEPVGLQELRDIIKT